MRFVALVPDLQAIVDVRAAACLGTMPPSKVTEKSMNPVNRVDAARASVVPIPHQEHGDEEALELGDFEAELARLSAANQELMEHIQAPAGKPGLVEPTEGELDELRRENAELRARIAELEACQPQQDEEQWLERQREYEMLLEEKSEVIRGLHLKIQEMQESALGGDHPAPPSGPTPSGTRLGQAEEILRLKRDLESQRRQLELDEEEMMGQMRQMEIAMAKERAEMARQRQEVQRLQAELNREVENATRDPELRDRLNTLRRHSDPKIALPQQGQAPAAAVPKDQKSSGFFRRIFG